MSTTTTAKPMTAAEILGCSDANAHSRLAALGYVETCGRCGGSGTYSFNQMDGNRCFGCRGCGKRLMKLTPKMLREAKARIDAGELTDYFARGAARKAAKKAIAPLLAEAEAIYATIGEAYDVAFKAGALGTLENRAPVWYAQTLNNDLVSLLYPRGGGRRVPNKFAGARWFGDFVAHGEMDAVVAIKILTERVEQLRTLRDAFLAFEAEEAAYLAAHVDAYCDAE